MVEMTDIAPSVDVANPANGKSSPAELAAAEAAKDPKLSELIALDTEYRKYEDEYSVKWAALQAEYEKLQAPLLEKRKEILNDNEKGIKGFWLHVLESHPIFADEIQDWDKEALELCTDIRTELLPDPSKKNQTGFKIIFDFDSSSDKLPFTNQTLTRVYHTGLESEFLSEIAVKKIEMEDEIEWKAGKNITIEMKKKGKGAKAKTIKEERASFFRLFFRTINVDEPEELKDLLDKSLLEMGFDAAEVDDDEELEQAYEDALEKVSDDAYEMGMTLRDNVIPFAIRWYTGEACPMEEDSDEEDDENEDASEEDEDSEDDDESEKKGKKKGGKLFDKKDGEKETSEGKKEECKQQ